MQLGMKCLFSHHRLACKFIQPSRSNLPKYTTLKSTGPLLFNHSFRSFHVHVPNLNQNNENHLHDEIFKLIREQEYWNAKRKLKKLTKNWFGFYKFKHDNQLALYLHGLVLLECAKDSENAMNLTPLQLSSDNGDKKACLLLATLSYLNDSQVENEKNRNYLKKFDENSNWNDEKLVELTIENYLKELIENCDSRYAYYALGKLYMKNQKYQQAHEAFMKSTAKKFTKGQYELGLLMRNGSPDGIISKNPELALELFKKSRFESKAHKQLVEMYLNGESTNTSYFKAAFQMCIYYLVKFVNSRFFMVTLILMEILHCWKQFFQ